MFEVDRELIKKAKMRKLFNDFQDFKANQNIVEDRWITKKGRHIWIDDVYTADEFYEANRYKGETKYLTKKELAEMDRAAQMSPWLKIDRKIKITDYRLRAMGEAIDRLPLKIRNMIKNIRVFEKGVGEDPHFIGRQDEIPKSYKRIGVKKSWRHTRGVYIIPENRAVIGLGNKGLYDVKKTALHEIGHAVWEKMNAEDRIIFEKIFERNQTRVRVIWGDYEANEHTELFAESFARYWMAKQRDWGNKRQVQKIGEISRFFNTRMQKYFRGG